VSSNKSLVALSNSSDELMVFLADFGDFGEAHPALTPVCAHSAPPLPFIQLDVMSPDTSQKKEKTFI
jgi:hypothetical protein